MIRNLRKADVNKVSDIWLNTNLEVHDFIPARYWEDNFRTVQEMLGQAEVYVYELDGGVSVSYSDTFVDAMHGGIISYSQEMLRNLYLDYFEGGLE